jgi:hypothetical protein
MNAAYRIDRDRLAMALFGRKKVPPYPVTIIRTEMDVPLVSGPTVRLKVIVRPGPNAGRAHRIFVECPECGVQIPAGRLHQHVGTAVCAADAPAAR